MMEEEHEVSPSSGIFDIKRFLAKTLSFWWLFAVCLFIGFCFAFYKNKFNQVNYTADALLSIKDNTNPLFTNNQSLTFNWGGTTDKVTTAIVQFQSRSHAESVVDNLQFYVEYFKEGTWFNTDVYKATPFFVYVDTTAVQLYKTPLNIKVVDQDHFELSTTFEEATSSGFHYGRKLPRKVSTPLGDWKKRYKFGEKVSEPFLQITVEKVQEFVPTGVWLINLADYWETVNKYKEIQVTQKPEGSSILQLSLDGLNKARLIDYINTSANVLQRNELNRKNKFAISTIRYIDSSLVAQAKLLKESENELDDFQNIAGLIDVTSQSQDYNRKLTDIEIQRRDLERRMNYYDKLRTYLENKTDYTGIQAPTTVGINEGSIVEFISRLVALSEERKKKEFTARPGAPVFATIDSEIQTLKAVIYENIASSKRVILEQQIEINREYNNVDAQIKRLPKEQQEFLKIQRKLDVNQNAYNVFQAKKAEAELVMAANVSDIYMIDAAKDTGDRGETQDGKVNYLIALLVGLTIPLTTAFVLTLLDNFIHDPKDLEKLSTIPLLGVLGRNTHNTNLVAHHYSKSAIAESFRGIRSSLHFIFNQDSLGKSRTVMVTSSVSGEGKTFASVNLATVYALSGKSVALVGLDLRKPKLFDDFNIENDKGVSNYLVNDCELADIIRTTEIKNLDLILSGPVPPNPSELLMSKRANELINTLKDSYDYVVLDTPPLGLVTDALEISKHVDATLYIVRQAYTRKPMLDYLNDKYNRGEIKNISFILNFYKDKRAYGYGYGSYSNGYHENGAHTSKKPLFLKFFKKWWNKISRPAN